MTRPNLHNIFLKSGEREELERLFAYTKKLTEEMRRDPEVGRRLLEPSGYFEMMEDKRQEEEEGARRAKNAPEPSQVKSD